MKTYTKSAIILLAALSLVGCSKTEEFSNPDSALEIASVSGISSYKLMSRAVISGESLPNNESAKGIGLFVTATDGGAYDGKTEGFSNVRYTFNGEKWSTTTPVYLSKTEGKLYGYFPYSGTATDLTAIPVASSLNGTDYLYATTNDVSYEEKSVNLQMNHALARFHLTIKKGDKYLKDCELSKIAIESKAIDSYGTMDITMGTVAGSKTEGETGCVIFDGDGVTGTVTKEGIEKDILLVPADNTIGKKDLTLTLTIDGSDAKINFSRDNGLDIRSGIQCNATIEIQDTGIKVIGVGVDVWGEGGSQTVQIDGHTVTVKLDEGVSEIFKDVWVRAYAQNENVVIEAFSKSGKKIYCQLDDYSIVTPQIDGNISKFVISAISKEVVVTIGVFGEGGCKEVTVGEHKVKVVYDNIEDIEKDIYAMAYVDEDKVIIEAGSFQGKRLVCNVGDNAKCERTITNDNFTFTISDIRSNIEAVLGYAPLITLNVTSGSNGMVWIGDDKKKTSGQFEAGQQVVIHAAPKDKFRLFKWDDNNRKTSRTVTVSESKTTYFASFISSDLIPGLFTVNTDKKQVLFSKGNLYGYHYNSFYFEDNQYTTPSNSYEQASHISHIYWSSNCNGAFTTNAYKDTGAAANDVFCANHPESFSVNGQTGWSVLTGAEWNYLLNSREGNMLAKARVHDMNGLLIFPDGYSLPSGYTSDGGTGMSKVNDKSVGFPSENIPDETFSEIEADGVVFLPAAGFRSGTKYIDDEPSFVYNVGQSGYYWSASPNGYDRAYGLHFDKGNVFLSGDDIRDQAYSVRLVKESK